MPGLLGTSRQETQHPTCKCQTSHSNSPRSCVTTGHVPLLCLVLLQKLRLLGLFSNFKNYPCLCKQSGKCPPQQSIEEKNVSRNFSMSAAIQCSLSLSSCADSAGAAHGVACVPVCTCDFPTAEGVPEGTLSLVAAWHSDTRHARVPGRSSGTCWLTPRFSQL